MVLLAPIDVLCESYEFRAHKSFTRDCLHLASKSTMDDVSIGKNRSTGSRRNCTRRSRSREGGEVVAAAEAVAAAAAATADAAADAAEWQRQE